MAETTYDYSISQDFPNHKVDPSRLAQEIRDSAIVTALGGILTSGDTCSITFKDALSGGDVTILDGIVAAHTGAPLTSKLSTQPVREIDVADLDSDYARSKCMGINFDASAGAWTKKDVSWPYHINVLNGEGYAGFAEAGDKAEFRVVPILVGAVVAPASQAATEIVVDPGVKALFANNTIFPGMTFKFKRDGTPGYPDNPNPEVDEYEIASFDPDTNTVALRAGLASDVPAMSLLYLTVKYGEAIELQADQYVNVGGAAAGAAPVPANTIFEIWYYAVSAKRVRLMLNIKYGPQNGN